MTFTFKNNVHNTTATVTAKGWRISQRQLKNLWLKLCGDPACHCNDYGGLAGPNKYRLEKIGGNLVNWGAQIKNEH